MQQLEYPRLDRTADVAAPLGGRPQPGKRPDLDRWLYFGTHRDLSRILENFCEFSALAAEARHSADCRVKAPARRQDPVMHHASAENLERSSRC
jgi:hypothetical protein